MVEDEQPRQPYSKNSVHTPMFTGSNSVMNSLNLGNTLSIGTFQTNASMARLKRKQFLIERRDSSISTKKKVNMYKLRSEDESHDVMVVQSGL